MRIILFNNSVIIGLPSVPDKTSVFKNENTEQNWTDPTVAHQYSVVQELPIFLFSDSKIITFKPSFPKGL